MTIKNLAQIPAEENNASVYGGKATNLSKMIRMGLPVPPGFVASTGWTELLGGACPETAVNNFKFRCMSAIRELSSKENGKWGASKSKPLVVSVRSGAPISMPGMMDTILNVGLTTSNLDAFANAYGSRKFALDCYRRLIQMYGETVKGIPSEDFSDYWNAINVFYYDGITESVLEDVIAHFSDVYEDHVGDKFPDDPETQLLESCTAVYRSWYSKKAKEYREIEGISEDIGTAVTVQKMVFGNLENSATGVAFTHNPNTGQLGIYGDFLEGAQGEDVVSGAFRVNPIETMMRGPYKQQSKQLQACLRDLYAQERDILDVEFTVEQGKLWVLQYRKAKRSTKASVRSIIEMVKKGEITSITATSKFLDLLPKKEVSLEDHKDMEFVGKGIGVTSELAVGKAALTEEFVNDCKASGEAYIFIANETAPEDTPKMKDAQGILTAQGGKLSHAAIVARGWDKPCVVSASQLTIDNDRFRIAGTEYEEGTLIKIDGESGCIWM